MLGSWGPCRPGVSTKMMLARDELSESESIISIIETSSIVRYESEELGEGVGVAVAFF